MSAPVLKEPRWTPPRFLNQAMKVMLTTPLLERLVGRSTALLRFSGRRSGRVFTTPISFALIDGRVIMTAHRTRSWWKNLAVNPRVRVRLDGSWRDGTALLLEGEESLEMLAEFLEALPSFARLAGVSTGPDGAVHRDDVSTVAGYTAVVAIDLDEPLTSGL